MTPMSDLNALVERIERGEGRDRDLEIAVWCALGWSFEKRGKDRKAWLYGPDGGEFRPRRDPDDSLGWLIGRMGVTDSLDAAVALVERVLPLAEWEVTTSGFKPGATVIPNGSPHGVAHASSPARALLAAALRALAHSDQTEQRVEP